MEHKAGIRGMGWALALAATLALPAGALAQGGSDTLRVGDVLGAPSGEPTVGTRSPFSYMLSPIYDALALVNADGSFAPQLAREWKIIDGETWHYTLRPNIRFQNGEVLNAPDLAQYFNWLNSEAGRATTIGAQTAQLRLAQARAIDATTLEFKTSGPNPIFDKLIQAFWLPAPKAWAEGGKDVFNKKPVGSGSYRVTDWGANGVEYQGFAESWRPPKIAKLSIIKVPDRTARRSAILSGQLDIAQGMDMDDVPVIEQAGHRVDFAPRPQVATWKMFNVSRDTAFKDKRVRQAANHAIDRASYVQAIYRGRTSIASQCAVPGSVGYNAAVKPYDYDPARAKQLLAEAGFPNGVDVTVHAFSPSPFPGMTDVNQVVAQQLSAVGLRVRLLPVALPDFLKAWNPGPQATTLGFEGQMFENHCNMVNLDATDGIRDNSCFKKPAYYCDEEEQKLLVAAESETDPGKRRALLEQLMKINADNAGMLFLANLIDLTGLSKSVQGFKNDNTRFNYHDVTLTR